MKTKHKVKMSESAIGAKPHGRRNLLSRPLDPRPPQQRSLDGWLSLWGEAVIEVLGILREY